MVKLLLILVCYLGTANCCMEQQKPLPKRPDAVRGWKAAEFDGVHSIAELLLSRNEPSDNGKIGVKVVEIITPDPCAEPNSYFGRPRARLRFYRPSDDKALCEETFLEGGSSLGSERCKANFGVTGIYINAIDPVNGWVWVDLRNYNLPETKESSESRQR